MYYSYSYDYTWCSFSDNSAHTNYLVKKYGDITPEAHSNLLETGTKVTNGDTKGKLGDNISVIKVIERGTNVIDRETNGNLEDNSNAINVKAILKRNLDECYF